MSSIALDSLTRDVLLEQAEVAIVRLGGDAPVPLDAPTCGWLGLAADSDSNDFLTSCRAGWPEDAAGVDELIATLGPENRAAAPVTLRWLDGSSNRVLRLIFALGEDHGSGSIVCVVKDISNEYALRAKVARSSRKDEETGLLTAHYFAERMDAEWRRSMREGKGLVYLQISFELEDADIATQKQTLITLGRVATRVARRPGDLISRIDEWKLGVLLPQTDIEGGLHVSQRCADAFERMTQASDKGPGIKGQLCVGVGHLGPMETAMGYEVLVDRATAAAKAAALQGGGIVHTASAATA